MWLIAIGGALLFCIALTFSPSNKWVPRRAGWPLGHGWATYNAATKTILDTGLSYEEAVAMCQQLNKR